MKIPLSPRAFWTVESFDLRHPWCRGRQWPIFKPEPVDVDRVISLVREVDNLKTPPQKN